MEELSVKVSNVHCETTSGEQSEKKSDDQSESCNFIVDASSKWQQLHNIKIHNDETDYVLEVENKSSYGFAQSFCALEPANPRFKIELLNFDHFKYIAVGFSCKGHLIDQIPGLQSGGQSVGYDSFGDLIVDKKSKKVGEKWKVGDVIECGIKFPNNYTGRGSNVKIYFTRNEQLVAETKLLMPENGYFPTVYVFEGVTGGWWQNGEVVNALGTGTKVKYF